MSTPHDILDDFSNTELVKTTIRANWENYHYCLGRSPTVELSVGRYLTWLVTSMPDHFMNLVVCTGLPASGTSELIKNSLSHFKALNIKKLSWLMEEETSATEIKKHLIANGLRFRESFATEMAINLAGLSEDISMPNGLEVIQIDDDKMLRKWIRAASIGFGVPLKYVNVWFDFFNRTVYSYPFKTYMAILNGRPVGTSQLFTSAGVAGIYNVSCMPEVQGKGIGRAITSVPLLDAQKLGYKVGVLQASQMGYKVYRKLSFDDFGKLSLYLWEQEPNDS